MVGNMNRRLCAKCKEQLDNDANFCEECGTQIGTVKTQPDQAYLTEELRLHKERICKYCGGKRSRVDWRCSRCGKGDGWICNRCGGDISRNTCKCKECKTLVHDCTYCGARGRMKGLSLSAICKTCGRPREY